MTLAAASPDALVNVALASAVVIGLRLLPQAFGRTRLPIPSFPGWLLARMGEIVVAVGLLRLASAIGQSAAAAPDDGALQVAIWATLGAFLIGLGRVVTLGAVRGRSASRITPPRPAPPAEATMILNQPTRPAGRRSSDAVVHAPR